MKPNVILDITTRLLHSFLLDAYSQNHQFLGNVNEVYDELIGISNGLLADFEPGFGGDRLKERVLDNALAFFEDTTAVKYLFVCPEIYKTKSRMLTLFPDDSVINDKGKSIEEKRERFDRTPAAYKS